MNELWQSGFVRFVGITLSITIVLSAIAATLEWSTATEEYPPKWNELPEVILGLAALVVLAYGVVAFLVWIWRKIT